jgi:hypothetical protein
MPGYQKRRGGHLDCPKSLKSIRMIVSIIGFWLNAEREMASGPKQTSYLRMVFEDAL